MTDIRLTVLGCGTSVGVPTIGCHCDVCISADPRDSSTGPAVAQLVNQLSQLDGVPVPDQALTEAQGHLTLDEALKARIRAFQGAHGLKPDGVPETKSDVLPRMISMELADTLAIPAPRSISFTEADVNAHLLKTVKAKDGVVPGVEFKRMFVNFLGGDVLRVGTEQSLWGYPVYSGMQFKLGVVGGKLGAECVGGNFGRLKVHPMIMKYADFAFQKLCPGFISNRFIGTVKQNNVGAFGPQVFTFIFVIIFL